jgi:hypothetical protein
VICAELKPSAGDDDEIAGDCSWNIVIAAIRCHARDQSDESRTDLNAWADLLEGVAELQARRD